MTSILEQLRSILGEADFYTQLGASTNYSWNYSAMIEYFVGALILCITISSIFRLLSKLVSR